MKKNTIFVTKMLSTLAIATGLSMNVWAVPGVSQECILTGEVQRSQADEHVRLVFKEVQHGNEARCPMANRRATRASVRFKAAPEVQNLPVGSTVRYHYRVQNGREYWDVLNVSIPIRSS